MYTFSPLYNIVLHVSQKPKFTSLIDPWSTKQHHVACALEKAVFEYKVEQKYSLNVCL